MVYGAGNDDSDGLTPGTPKATVQAVLLEYDIEPGDIVRIDYGRYYLTSDIRITEEDEGSCLANVTFKASPYGVTFNRGYNNSSYVSILSESDYITIKTIDRTKYPTAEQSLMKNTGAEYGVFMMSADTTDK